ncbi:hypothetical protein Vi05172_g11121 [Venturia inaequalis]|nr:hypothetical protein Vi05172_g11121 [Venturia inaequalis]
MEKCYSLTTNPKVPWKVQNRIPGVSYLSDYQTTQNS